MIFVTGATGNIGRPLTSLLASAGHPVRALTRDAKKVGRTLGANVALVEGDLTRPNDLAAALAGVDRCIFVAHAGPRLADVGEAFFRVAKGAGVRHIVAVSSGTVLMGAPITIGRWHLAMEERLKASGLEWTMLRPGNFTSNTLQWAGMIRSQSTVFAPHGDAKSAPIDPRDIAAVAAEALASPGHEGKTYTLTGSEVLSTRAQVEKVGHALGKPIRFVEAPGEKARAGMLGSGMPEFMADALIELLGVAASQVETLKTSTVREVTGRDPRTLDDWLSDNVKAFG